jgi:hypothetical protein
MTENKPVAKAAATPAIKKTSAARKPAAAKALAKPEKKEKKAKVKVIRDSFTMPQVDYDIIAEIKQKALKAGLHVKKSELLRAGLQVLAKLSAAQLKQTIVNLEKIKTGRPKNI